MKKETKKSTKLVKLGSKTAQTSVQKTSDKIKELLEKDGSYNSSFDLLINNCAQLCYLRDEAFSLLQNDGIAVSEVSREGENRLKAHPCCAIYLDISKELRTALNDLRMTARTAQSSDHDALDELDEKMQSASFDEE